MRGLKHAARRCDGKGKTKATLTPNHQQLTEITLLFGGDQASSVLKDVAVASGLLGGLPLVGASGMGYRTCGFGPGVTLGAAVCPCPGQPLALVCQSCHKLCHSCLPQLSVTCLSAQAPVAAVCHSASRRPCHICLSQALSTGGLVVEVYLIFNQPQTYRVGSYQQNT